jgi:hypothetical protein
MQISKAQEAEQMLTFSKMTGIGNDYIYVNCFQETVVNPEKLSIFMSDVRFGVGSDGLVLILPSEMAIYGDLRPIDILQKTILTLTVLKQ